MDKDEMCKQVLELEPKIRFAGLINENGRLVAGGMKPDSSLWKIQEMMRCYTWS
jgi:hypothetical protein